MAEKRPRQSSSAARESLEEVVRASGLIFIGTVVGRGMSSVSILQPSDELVVVRVDRGLRVDPALGDLKGEMVTVAARDPQALNVGKQAVFLTTSWVHGRGIAVRELDHLDVRDERKVATAVARLPELHILDRLRGAELVVLARVVRITEGPRTTLDRNAALWAAAHLEVEKVLRGTPGKTTVVYFPTSPGPPWQKAPRFKRGQRGVFILHRSSSAATQSEESLEPGSLVALDPADYQPESELAEIERLLKTIGGEGGTR